MDDKKYWAGVQKRFEESIDRRRMEEDGGYLCDEDGGFLTLEEESQLDEYNARIAEEAELDD